MWFINRGASIWAASEARGLIISLTIKAILIDPLSAKHDCNRFKSALLAE